MNWFLARNIKQVEACVKMMYDEDITSTTLKVVETSKGKIEYLIGAAVSDELFTRLVRRYRIMIS